MERKEISDLGLVAALITIGYSPIERRKEGRRVLFTFEWNEDLEAIQQDYFNHRLVGDLNTYQANIKSIKSSIYQMGE